ncbi:18438_t:CDS:2 [Funneliformis geosporum]|uniref:18438_t:CDS:1 n=1 Tax=Funneliformis geosporum TaxID=1117311 RepID=A0A9W4SGH4_9GLOM|nr:18438_t:CDS:2 [Funneliformis geosporum]
MSVVFLKVVESGKKKEVEEGDEIIIDKVLERDGEFGQPYLPIKLIGKVVKNVKNKKIFGMKYKSKKRTKRVWGHQEAHTLIKIVAYCNMSKNFYNLLREKNKLEKERDKSLVKLLESIVDWEFGGGSGRRKLLEEYKRVMADIKVIQQHLELVLAGEVSDKAEF